jgi:hypothetical protein
MSYHLRLSYLRALLPGRVLAAVPAGGLAQPRGMGMRMGNPGMAQRPGPTGMAQPFRGMSNVGFGAMSPLATPGMEMPPAMRYVPTAVGGMPATGFGGYGMEGYGTMPSYGNTQPSGILQPSGDPGVSTKPQAYAAAPQPRPEGQRLSRLLTASGVPNDNGPLRWPLGLRILAAPGAGGLREQIGALFGEAVRQAAAGSVNPTLADEARQAVQKLRTLLREDRAERCGMPLAVYQESEQFLNNLDRAGRLLRAGLGSPGEPSSGTAESSSTPDATGARK